DDAVRATPSRGKGGGNHSLLPARLVEDEARAATASVQEGAARRRPPSGRGKRGGRRAPSGLEQVVVARANPEAGSANRRHVHPRGGPVNRLVPERRDLVSVVAGGAEDADPIEPGLDVDVVVGHHGVGRELLAEVS